MAKKQPSRTRRRKTAGGIAAVSTPRMPPVYGMKPRKSYLPWRHAEERLERSRSYWICTTRADGRPHAMPVWGMWLDGGLYFGTGRSTQKGRNIARNPAVSMHLESGDDVVIVEGDAEEVKLDAKGPLRKQLDTISQRKYDMPLLISEESAIYRLRPRVVFAWTEKEFPKNATRWKFSG